MLESTSPVNIGNTMSHRNNQLFYWRWVDIRLIAASTDTREVLQSA
jgi:hypothetical protein